MASPHAKGGLTSIHGRRLQVGPNDHLYQNNAILLAAANNPLARNILVDDFVGPALDSDRWDGLIGTSTAAVLPTVTAGGKNGYVTLTTGLSTNGTLATNGVQLHSDLNWQAGNGNLVFETRLKADAVTSVRVFAGFTDQVAALESPISSTGGDTFSTDATDAVGFVFDTVMTTDDWWAMGVKAGTDATGVDTTSAPTAATYQKLRIEIDSTGTAVFFIDGVRKAVVTSAVTSTAPLSPAIVTTGLSSAARVLDVDYIYCAQDR